MGSENHSIEISSSDCEETVLIPELEDLPAPRQKAWSEKEIEALRKYYPRYAERRQIAELVRRWGSVAGVKRSKAEIYAKANRLGVQGLGRQSTGAKSAKE